MDKMKEEMLMKLFDIKNAKPASIPWLPQCKEATGEQSVAKHQGIFVAMHKNKPYHEGLWQLLQFSMPPYFAKKFHIVNVAELMKDSVGVNYMSIASCIVLWNEALGLPLMQIISNHHSLHEFSEITKSQSGNDMFKDSVNDITKYLKMTLQGAAIKPLTKTDLCTRAEEFILEPCILIQLPWQPVLFHQWLVAALAEVLAFERDSLELRHWPLPLEIIPLAENTFTLVRKLKERVVLGFMILNHMVELHPEVDRKNSDIILDDIVLPSLPVLQFLTTGKAYKILKLIKIFSYSKSESFAQKALDEALPVASYCMDSTLSEFFCTFCYNYQSWGGDEVIDPFASFEDDIDDVVKKVRTNNCGPSNYDTNHNSLLHSMEKNKSAISKKLNKQQRLDLTLSTIKTLVIDTGKMPGLDFSEVEHYFKTPQAVINADEIFAEGATGEMVNIIRIALMYHQVCRYLIGCEKEQSALAQVVTLQLKVLQQDLVAKLILMLVLQFKKLPVLKKLESMNPINVKSLLQEVQAIHQMIAKQNRWCLWNQLPFYWRKPVSCGEECPDISDSMDRIISSFENRIGRLVYNTAVQSFTVNANGGDMSPDWTTIQYILPCFVASFFEQNKLHYPSLNILKFIHAVIKSFESRYHRWVKEGKLTETDINIMQCNSQQELLTLKNELSCLNLKIRENLRIVVGYQVMQMFYDATITGIDQVLNFIHNWPMIISYTTPQSVCPDFLVLLNNWWKFSYLFSEHLLQIASELWKVPKPGVEMTVCPMLGHLYQTNAIISELEVVFDLAKQNTSRNCRIEHEVNDAMKNIKQHRIELYRAVVKADSLCDEELNNIVESKRKVVLNVYQKLKKFKKQAGKLKFCLEDLLPYSRQYPHLKPAVLNFLNGDFTALEEQLLLFAAPKVAQKDVRKCKQCSKPEMSRKFVVCEKCVKDDFPDVNFYCGRRCQDVRWKEEHMAEHLEFELGLGDFAALNVKDGQ